jgi:hypothetical protein
MLVVDAKRLSARSRIFDRDLIPIWLFVLTATALAAALWFTRTVDPLRGDSAEYLYFDPSRTVGYPAFLALVRLLTGNVGLAVHAQMLLLAVAMFSLGLSFYRFTTRPVLSLVFHSLLIAMPAVWAASSRLMTEGLSTCLVALWCALALRIVTEPSSRRATMLVVISALATMVRPSLVALFFATAALILLIPHRPWRKRVLLRGATGLVLAWAVTPVAQLVVHGSAHTTSPLARGVLQHTLYCEQKAIPPDWDSQFVEENAAAVRSYIGTLPPSMHEEFRKAYSTPLRFGLIIPVLGRRHHLQVRSQVDQYLSPIAWQRVRTNPSCYASSVAREYIRLATFETDPTAEEARGVRTLIEVHPPFQLPQFPVLAGDARMTLNAATEVHDKPSGLNSNRTRFHFDQKIPALAVLPARLLSGAAALAGVLSFLVLVMRGRRKPAEDSFLLPTAAIGVALHGVLAITAIVEFSEERYLAPIWPLVCIADLLVVPLVIEAAKRALQFLRSKSPLQASRAVA